MPRSARCAWGAALAVVLFTSCGDGSSRVEAGPGDAVSGSASSPDDWLVGCGSRGYPPEAFQNPVGAESAESEPAAALRELLAQPVEVEPVPESGYRLLYEDSETAIFGAAEPIDSDGNGTLTEVEFRRATAGGPFEYQGSIHGCTPHVVLSDRNLVEFTLAPDVNLSPDIRRVDVLVRERACRSGAETGERLLPPEVRYNDDSVEVLFAATPLEGDSFDCMGIPAEPATWELPEPLGNRRLLDASRYPPRDVAASDSGQLWRDTGRAERDLPFRPGSVFLVAHSRTRESLG